MTTVHTHSAWVTQAAETGTHWASGPVSWASWSYVEWGRCPGHPGKGECSGSGLLWLGPADTYGQKAVRKIPKRGSGSWVNFPRGAASLGKGFLFFFQLMQVDRSLGQLWAMCYTQDTTPMISGCSQDSVAALSFTRGDICPGDVWVVKKNGLLNSIIGAGVFRNKRFLEHLLRDCWRKTETNSLVSWPSYEKKKRKTTTKALW